MPQTPEEAAREAAYWDQQHAITARRSEILEGLKGDPGAAGQVEDNWEAFLTDETSPGPRRKTVRFGSAG